MRGRILLTEGKHVGLEELDRQIIVVFWRHEQGGAFEQPVECACRFVRISDQAPRVIPLVWPVRA